MYLLVRQNSLIKRWNISNIRAITIKKTAPSSILNHMTYTTTRIGSSKTSDKHKSNTSTSWSAISRCLSTRQVRANSWSRIVLGLWITATITTWKQLLTSGKWICYQVCFKINKLIAQTTRAHCRPIWSIRLLETKTRYFRTLRHRRGRIMNPKNW